MEHDSECIVSGLLGFVLRVSRFCGLAPFRVNSEDDGWRISATKTANFYGVCGIWILCVTSWISLILRLFMSHEEQSYITSDIVVQIVSESVLAIVLLIQTRHGFDRTNNMIACLAQIQKINVHLNKIGSPNSFDKIRRIMTVWTSISVCMIVVEYSITCYNIVNEVGYLTIEAMYGSHYIEIGVSKVLYLQVSLILLELISSFNHLNACLKQLLQQIHKELSRNPKALAVSQTMRQYNNISYSTINDIIDSLGVNKVATGAGYFKFILKVYWCTCISSDTFMIIESCHQIHTEINNTKQLISQLLRFSPPDHKTLISELEEFYMLLTTTPINIFQFKRNDIITIIGITSTYVFVLV